MTGHAKRMLDYYRSVLLAQTACRTDLRKGKYQALTPQEFQLGQIKAESAQQLFREAGHRGKNGKAVYLPVVICAKTLRVIIRSGSKDQPDLEGLTGIFFVPGILGEDGSLHMDKRRGKLPWIPREFLQPFVEEELSVGHVGLMNQFLSESLADVANMGGWADYAAFSRDFYEAVTLAPFDGDAVPNFTDGTDCRVDGRMYLLPYRDLMSPVHIQKLYGKLLEEQPSSRLLESFLSTQPAPLNLPVENDLSSMRRHSGQMSGVSSLSPSQRDALNHACVMEEGEVLAVNGPPGTGKSFLLQALAANLLVEHALVEGRPPIIVVATGSEHARGGILASFANRQTVGLGNLEQRWITGADSLAVSLPSPGRVAEEEQAGYQWADPAGRGLLAEADTRENLQESSILLVSSCNRYFSTAFSSVSQCKKHIHQKLQELEGDKTALLNLFAQLEPLGRGNRTVGEYTSQLRKKVKTKQQYVQQMYRRVSEWKGFYEQIPAMLRGLRTIPSQKTKIADSCRAYMNEEEKEFLLEPLSIESVTEQYRLRCESIGRDIERVQESIQRMIHWEKQLLTVLSQLKKNNVVFPQGPEELSRLSLWECNALLDRKIRYVSFWLAVHYYECCWALKDHVSSTSLAATDSELALEKFYLRLATLAPCQVMSLSMLPKHMQVPQGGESSYLYSFIDLLLIDEAGQTAPEYAACSFALARRAVVLGDDRQTEPPFSLSHAQDQALALQSGVVSHGDQFTKLESYGLGASSSSVMWVAGKSCRYEKYNLRGLVLTEHRACYNEIIEYCNQLTYEGVLEPQRGTGAEDLRRALPAWPQMGYRQIGCRASSRAGGSRYNRQEAREIASWLRHNLPRLRHAYPQEPEEALVWVLTPFKAQAACIRQELRKLGLGGVAVSTAATQSGSPRRVVLFSPVYGGEEECFWIDQNPNLMSAVVSRARDHFFFFGDMGCLQLGSGTPSELLQTKLTFFPLPD